MKTAIKAINWVVLFAWGLVNIFFLFGECTENEHLNVLPNLLAILSSFIEYEVYMFLSRRGLTFSKIDDEI